MLASAACLILASHKDPKSNTCSCHNAAKAGSQLCLSASCNRVGDDDSTTDSDGWCVMPPSIFDVDPPPIRSDPMENLFIEHSSMSVYNSIQPRLPACAESSTEPSEVQAEVVSSSQRVATTPVRFLIHDNIIRTGKQQSYTTKKKLSRRACNRQNQLAHQPKHARQTVARCNVFQPRKY